MRSFAVLAAVLTITLAAACGGDDKTADTVASTTITSTSTLEPTAEQVTLGADGQYSLDARPGCEWRETGRATAPISNRTFVVLQSDCTFDVLHFYPDSGDLIPMSVLVQPEESPGPPPPTFEIHDAPEPPDITGMPSTPPTNDHPPTTNVIPCPYVQKHQDATPCRRAADGG